MATTPTQVIDRLAVLIEALVPVTRANSKDGFHRYEGPPPPEGLSEMGDRNFLIAVERGPGDDQTTLRNTRRTMELSVAFTYAQAPKIWDRAMDDAKQVADLIDTLATKSRIPNVQMVRKVEPLPVWDYFANVVLVTHEFEIVYSAES